MYFLVSPLAANSPHSSMFHDLSLVIGGKLHSEILNILVFLYWWQIYSRNIPFFLHRQPARARLQTHTICLLNIKNNSLYNAFYYMCKKITSHWQPLFSKKMAAGRRQAAASFSYKIGGGGLIFLQNWRWQGFGNIIGGCSDIVWILELSNTLFL